jgi:hypothetical protein
MNLQIQARETHEVLQENVINAGGARINESIEEVNQPSAGIFLHPVMDSPVSHQWAREYRAGPYLRQACVRD